MIIHQIFQGVRRIWQGRKCQAWQGCYPEREKRAIWIIPGGQNIYFVEFRSLELCVVLGWGPTVPKTKHTYRKIGRPPPWSSWLLVRPIWVLELVKMVR